MRPLPNVYGYGTIGSKPGSARSITSMDLLPEDIDASEAAAAMMMDFKTGSSRSLLSFELLPTHEERQCSDDSSDIEDEVELLSPKMMNSIDCPIGPLILKLERVSTGDSVVPLDENIRMSSADWPMGINFDASDVGTGHPTQDSGCASMPPLPALESPEYPTAISFDDFESHMRTRPKEYPISSSSMYENKRPSINSLKLMNEPIKISSSRWVKDFQEDASGMGTMEPSEIFEEPPDSSISVPSSPASSTTSTKTKKSRPRSISDYVITPTDNDILFGRGGYTNTNPGNIRFREEALQLRPHYELLTKPEKYDISVVLIERMKNEKRRFLEKASDGMWHEVDDKGARKKASQALRERLRSTSP